MEYRHQIKDQGKRFVHYHSIVLNLHNNIDFILSTMIGKRFIFNVGHGLTPDCKIENIREVIKQVKNFKN